MTKKPHLPQPILIRIFGIFLKALIIFAILFFAVSASANEGDGSDFNLNYFKDSDKINLEKVVSENDLTSFFNSPKENFVYVTNVTNEDEKGYAIVSFYVSKVDLESVEGKSEEEISKLEIDQKTLVILKDDFSLSAFAGSEISGIQKEKFIQAGFDKDLISEFFPSKISISGGGVYTGYKYPWPQGENWRLFDDSTNRTYYSLGGWHQDSSGWALDYIPSSNSTNLILSSAPGTVTWTCQDGQGQSAVRVKTTGYNETMRYYHLNSNSFYAQVGQILDQGDKVGTLAIGSNSSVAGCNLRSGGTHIHFGVPFRPVTLEGQIHTSTYTPMGANLYSTQDMEETLSVDFSASGEIALNSNVTANVENTGLTQISKVEFYKNNTLVSTANAEPFSFNYTNLGLGNQSLMVRIFDDLNNLVEQEAVRVYPTLEECTFEANQWCGQYYDQVVEYGNLTNQPIIKKETFADLNFDWGNGSPTGLNSDYFTALYKTQRNFEEGIYRFDLSANNGVLIFMDGEVIFDGRTWETDLNNRIFYKEIQTSGNKNIEVYYYEGFGGADLKFSWSGAHPCDVDPTGGFADITGQSSLDQYICRLKTDGIISGSNSSQGIVFKPLSNVTRGEMAKFIKSGFEFSDDTSCDDFSDMAPGSSFYVEAKTLKCMGIVSGSGGNFNPSQNVTRAEAMIFLTRSRIQKYGGDLNNYNGFGGFEDVSSSSLFYPFIMNGAGNGYISGQLKNGKLYFRPTSTITRAEMAKIVDSAR